MAEPTLIERLRGAASIQFTGPALTALLTEAAAALERHSLPGGAAGYRLVPEEPTEAGDKAASAIRARSTQDKT